MSNFKFVIFVACGFLRFSNAAFAWDGANIDTGDAVTIPDGTAIAEGASIQIIDQGADTPRSVTISSITQTDAAVEIAVVDDDSGDLATYDFDPADTPPELTLPEAN